MWNPVEKEMLDKMRAQQEAQVRQSRERLSKWKMGSDVDPSLLSGVSCPCCAGSGKAQVQSLRSGEVWTVDLYRCSEVRCASCYGTGKMRKDLLTELLAQVD